MTNPTGSILLRRGPTSDRVAFVPLEGEIIYDTDAKKVFIGDGETFGGRTVTSDIVLEDGNIFNIPNSSLENSTISGIELGNNLRTLTIGTGLSGVSYNGSTAVTIAVDSTSSNVNNSLVARDANGNFSANIITASLNGNASTATNGVVTTGSYSDPSWIVSLSETKVLPNQTGNNGKTLVTDGTTVSWQDYIPVKPAPNTLPVYGRWLNTNGTTLQWTDPYPSQPGNAGRFLQTNGATVGWASAGAIGFPSIVGNDGKFLKVIGPDIVWDNITSASNGVLTLAVSGIGISGSQTFSANQSTDATFTVASNATALSSPSTLVARDDLGSFSANIITASLLGNVTGNVLGNVTGNLTGNADTVTNGVVTTGSYANPSWIASLSIAQGGTGSNTQIGALTNLLPIGEAAGFVLKTSGRGTYFWSAESGGAGTAGNTISTTRTSFTTTAGQSSFNVPEYVVGAGQLRIYIDGVRQFPSEYTETSSTSFVLDSGLPANTKVMAEIDAFVGQTITASVVTSAPTSTLTSTTVQNALNELDQKKAALDSPSFAGVVSFNSYASVQSLLEKATITNTAPLSTTDFNVADQAVQYYTVNTTNSFIVNIRGNGSLSLNNMLTVGQSVSLALMITCNSTTHYATAIQVDGSAANVTTKWQGGLTPSSGNSSSIDVYTLTVIKTAVTPAYTVLATQTKFA
jgi:hypothetical protein